MGLHNPLHPFFIAFRAIIGFHGAADFTKTHEIFITCCLGVPIYFDDPARNHKKAPKKRKTQLPS